MNKVICDICGTDYPETASQCPICGCTQRSAGATVADGEKQAYTYVKGGRFSKSNVRKRLKGAQVPTTTKNASKNTPKEAPQKTPEAKKAEVEAKVQEPEEEEEEQGSSVVLIVIVILLLLAIIAVTGYIAVKYFDFSFFSDTKNPGTSQTTAPTIHNDPTTPTGEEPTQSTNPVKIPCTELNLSSTKIEFSEVGSEAILEYTCMPEDTTDAVNFETSDDSVATVDENGKITAVGKGSAWIIVECGNNTRKCQVICDFEEPIDPTQTYILKIDGRVSRYGDEFNADVSMKVGGKFKLTLENADGEIQDVDWVISDEECVTIDGTTVECVAKKTVTISVTIGEQDYVCIVRIS